MSRWYDLEVERLEKEHEQGLLTDDDFYQEMRELNNSLRQEAEENAERAYRETIGY